MSLKPRLALIGFIALSLAGLASACDKAPAEQSSTERGTAQKVGENIDNAVQSTQDAARDVKKALNEP